MKHPKVLCTPHLGASTVEAQDRVAVETVEMLSEALKGSPFVAAVNLPFPAGGDPHAALPWMRLAELAGAFLGQAAEAPPTRISVTLACLPEGARKAAVVAAVKGVLVGRRGGQPRERAPRSRRSRGIALVDSVREDASGYANLLTVAVDTPKGSRSVSATLFGDQHGRIVSARRPRAGIPAAGHDARPRRTGTCRASSGASARASD